MIITNQKIKQKQEAIAESEVKVMLKALSEHQKMQDENMQDLLRKLSEIVKSLSTSSKVVHSQSDSASDAEVKEQIGVLLEKLTDSMGDINMARLKDIQTFSKAIDHLTNNLKNDALIQSINELKETINNREPMEWRFDIVRDQRTGAMLGFNAKQVK